MERKDKNAETTAKKTIALMSPHALKVVNNSSQRTRDDTADRAYEPVNTELTDKKSAMFGNSMTSTAAAARQVDYTDSRLVEVNSFENKTSSL